jgi:hypothetical protein
MGAFSTSDVDGQDTPSSLLTPISRQVTLMVNVISSSTEFDLFWSDTAVKAQSWAVTLTSR